ncbi:2-oxo acid dehydrogenase subunit E2 [Streptomyces sp. KL116D]|uniref:2-oxo acid dehydrogenase subunit E2 n=1 Tax=Streptomyces sp. KL116D TaxID=3045152 RepID=UPI003558F3EB
MTRIRRAIGNNLKQALQGAGAADQLRGGRRHAAHAAARPGEGRLLAREGIKLSPLPFFIKAAAQALRAHPVINARIDEAAGTITYFDTENIGIAVDTEDGLTDPGRQVGR